MSSSGDQPAGLQWTLNVPSTVQSVTTAVGSAASSAGKSISCANNICIISAMNTTPIASGVVAVLSVTLSSAASGTLSIQLSGGIAVDPTGTAIPVTVSGGTITVTTPITVSLTPTSATLSASQTQQFTATVSGTSNTAVQWSMSGTVGTLSSTGLYTAPSSISVTEVISITATSAASLTVSATATVTLVPTVQVTLQPASVSLLALQTYQFQATVSGTSNTGVTWSVAPVAGTISSSGLYTAPRSTAITVTATSVVDTTKSASANVYLTAYGFTAVVFSSGIWYVDQNRNGTFDGVAGGDQIYYFGQAGDVPVVGDWTGTGVMKIGIFRSGQWFLDCNGNGVWDGVAGGDCLYNFGQAGDIPVTGDWNGSGTTKIGVYRNGYWMLDVNGNGVWDGISGGDNAYWFGNSTYTPVVGDWNGSGTAKAGLFSQGVWYLDVLGNGQWTDGVTLR